MYFIQNGVMVEHQLNRDKSACYFKTILNETLVRLL